MPLLTVAAHARPSEILPALLAVAYVQQQDGNKLSDVRFNLVENPIINRKGCILAFEDYNGSRSYDQCVLRMVLKASPESKLPINAQFHEWLPIVDRLANKGREIYFPALQELDAHLIFNSYIIGSSLTLADFAAWGALRDHEVAFTEMQDHFENVYRWYKHIQEQQPWINNMVLYLRAFNDRVASAIETPISPSTKPMGPLSPGGVTVRFCPKFSGYSHVGHAKAALLNDHFVHERHRGKFIFRLDDSKPSMQMAHFQATLSQDLKALGILPDKKSYISDYFEAIEGYVVALIRGGHAFADILDEVMIKNEKGDKTQSKYRNMSVEDTMAWFEEIRAGSYKGTRRCIRAKIDSTMSGSSTRDPIIYRPVFVHHHRTGSKFKAYPSYELAMAVVDSLEGVTHAIIDDENPDRNKDYCWFQSTLGLSITKVLEYPHLNLKRSRWMQKNIAHLVSEGSIRSGWDHLRRPTLNEMMRRGLLMTALREFCLMRSSLGGNEQSTWTMMWAVNNKHLELHCPRYMAVDKYQMVYAEIMNGPNVASSKKRPRNRQNLDLGDKYVAYGRRVLIDHAEAVRLEIGDQVTLLDWGDAIVRDKTSHNGRIGKTVTSIKLDLNSEKTADATEVKTESPRPLSVSSSPVSTHTDSNSTSSFPTSRQLPWLAIESHNLIPVELFDFESLSSQSAASKTPQTPNFPLTHEKAPKQDDNSHHANGFLNLDFSFRSEALGDCNLSSLSDGEAVHLEGKGYFRVDKAYSNGEPLVLFSIPTGNEPDAHLGSLLESR